MRTQEEWGKLVRAVNSDVIIIPDKPKEKKTDSGIIIAETTQKTPYTGVIIAVGPDYSGEFKFGDRVQYRPSSSTPMEHPCGELLMHLKSNQILWGIPDEQ